MPRVTPRLPPSPDARPAPCGVRTPGGGRPAAALAPCSANPPGPGLERGRFLLGDIFCPLAPTPETKGANALGGSERLSLKPGRPARLHPPALLRAWSPKVWSLFRTVSRAGYTHGKDPSFWSWEPERRQQLVPDCATWCWLLGLSAHVLEEWGARSGVPGSGNHRGHCLAPSTSTSLTPEIGLVHLLHILSSLVWKAGLSVQN